MGSLFLRRSHNSSFFFSCQQNLAERFANSSRGGLPFSCKFSQLASPSPKRDGPLSFYRSLVQQGKLKHDIYQERVASELEDLLERLKQYEKEMEKYHATVATWEKNREAERRRLLMEEAEVKQKGGIKNTVNKRRSEFFNKWFRWRKSVDIEPGAGRMVSYLNREKKLDSVVGTRPVAPQAPKGLYLYGSVGSGKTMLMDMFYSATDGIVKHRRRFHFHEAMLQINEHMHKFWKNQVEEKTFRLVISDWIESLPFDTKVKQWLAAEEKYKQEVQMKHILLAVADRFLADGQDDKGGASILCFDEIQTVDVFAIVALSGILSRLLSTGTVLVATSNRAPEDLNQDGMQKDIFLKLVTKLEEHCQNIVVGRDIDYRRLIAKKTVEKVPESCDGVARFEFDYLCGRPLGAADYIAIAKNYHTVFISDIPLMSMRIRDKARRFITLIDELYNHHCCLFCTAAASIDDLFQGTDEGALFDLESFQFETEIDGGKLRRDVLAEGSIGSGPAASGIASLLSGQEEMFAFRRAVSRLIEMQTSLYLEGVRQIHPYFQWRQGCEEPLNIHRSTQRLQLS